MMKIMKEFREFAVKGNVIDLAVGVIIGGAFGKIVTSMVNDIIMPPISALIGNVNFKDLFLVLKPLEDKPRPATLAAATADGIPVLAYGQFINILLDFTIIAFCIFMLVKGLNALRRMQNKDSDAPVEPTVKECPYCLSKVPLKATRCGHCTSHLKDDSDEVSAVGGLS
ncbi:large conductance mechanosensitive channel protein MscL [Paenibacillus oenotherae]|uniref:Large-conductance mechanosensitive channel n=1 Tax=Paenibacillus oenotherae TaxID=1435645 RepID=A0ABS7D7U7_9BACL|nr:large conductance mechanosensitive channel protein MscL [Paenibacillus oenotherae]MBW7476014.1 large conductance mechanosensitive channel protein MscL [Paenibacillus oenotherae]